MKIFSTEKYSERIPRELELSTDIFLCLSNERVVKKKIFYLICLKFYAFNQILWFYGTSILVFRAGTFRVKLFRL